MNVNELKTRLNSVNYHIERILRETGYAEWEELSEVKYDEENPDDLMVLSELSVCVSKLDEVSRTLKYLERQVRVDGVLRKNDNGRYEIEDYELTSGSSVEVLVFDEIYERYEWVAASIEHNGEDYYFTGKRDWELNGSRARVR